MSLRNELRVENVCSGLLTGIRGQVLSHHESKCSTHYSSCPRRLSCDSQSNQALPTLFKTHFTSLDFQNSLHFTSLDFHFESYRSVKFPVSTLFSLRFSFAYTLQKSCVHSTKKALFPICYRVETCFN